ncbi:MAG: helix-turn-helix domain-containing protein [Oscillospiraceae bacterium]|jgi:transcriptional regulator with XRE-family HTH domain|nr:helix-turn-helix domain-containing protein [Oscillospiraceae bacterium]
MKERRILSEEDILKGIPLADVIKNNIISEVSTQLMSKRLDLRMTQDEFAKHIGISQSLLSKYENGTENLTAKSIGDILGRLGLTVELKCMPIMTDMVVENTKTRQIENNITYFITIEETENALASGF